MEKLLNSRDIKALAKFDESGMSTKDLATLNYLYFYRESANIDSNTQIELKAIPQNVTYKYTSNFAAQAALSRTSPLFIYENGSDKVYSFTLTLHEDTQNIISTYGSLNNLIELIKSLSYPDEQFNDTYFQLGEITGTGIVNTSIVWKKPFRDGRYIMADVTFNIILTKEFKPLTYSYIEVEVERGTGIVQKVPQITSTDLDKYRESLLTSGKYDVSIGDFISNEDTKEAKEYYFKMASAEFDYQKQVIIDIFGTFEILGSTAPSALLERQNKTIAQIEELKSYSTIKGNKRKKKKLKKYIEQTIKEMKKYIEKQYKENPNMLQSERDAALKKLDDIYKYIVSSFEEMGKYGTSS